VVTLELRDLTFDYPDGTRAVDGVSLRIPEGRSIVVAGPSGGGKTTLLRTIAGLESPTAGDVLFDGQPVTSLSVRDRDIAFVGARDALYRHLDVEGNLIFPLALRALDHDQREQRVRATSRVLRLSRLLGRRPHTLSGGERQRASLGRATGRRPQLFLFDEPLAQIEPGERSRLSQDLRTTQQGMGVTTIFVTHEQREVMTLGDRLAVMNHGRIEQVGEPLEVYRFPTTTAVATFVGDPPMALVRGDLDLPRGTVTVAGTALHLSPEARRALVDPPRTILVGLRAEHLRLPRSGDARLGLRVRTVATVGPAQLVTGDLHDRPASRVTAAIGVEHRVRPGDVVAVAVDAKHLHLFDAASGRALHPVAVR
jgi:multiple sugar transport system ATP-binding protein